MKKELIRNIRKKLFPFMLVITIFSGFCRPNRGKADLILLNGKVITVDRDFTITDAIAIRKDKIVAIGSNERIKRFASDSAQIIDLKGKAVIPGLIDAHTHPERASLSELHEAIPDLHTIRKLLDWIKYETSIKRDGEWIIHPRMFYTRLNDLRPPTLSELDQAASRNPVFLNGSYGGVINSAAMKASGITEKTMHEGLIRDVKTGMLTGFIRASAFKLLKLPPPKQLTNQQKIEALKTMFRKYNQYGITGVISGYTDLESYRRYKEMSEKGELTVRVCQNFLLPFDIRDSRERLVDSLKMFPVVTGQGDEWVRTGSLKIKLDGGILTGTAYLREPWGKMAQHVYAINSLGYRGTINYTREELLDIVSVANRTGWAFTAHCTGGGGVDMLLDVFEEVNKVKPIKDRRFSIIHGNFFTKEAIGKMQKLGIIAQIQPAWFYKDADAMKYILGEERIKTFNPYHSMTESGVILCGGSDHMIKLDANTSINPYNPFLAMWTMVTRTTEKGTVITPEEAITREQALKIYTINIAYASFEEFLKGSIEPGKLADMVVLSDDLLTCPIDRIKDIQSELTLVGGKVVYSSKCNQMPAN